MDAIGVTRLVCTLGVMVSAYMLGGWWAVLLAFCVWLIWVVEDGLR